MEFYVDMEQKLDSYFLNWLTDPSQQKMLLAIENMANSLENGGSNDFDFSIFNDTPKVQNHPQPKLPVSSNPSIQKPSIAITDVVSPPSFTEHKGDHLIPTFYGIFEDEDQKKAVSKIFEVESVTISSLFTILQQYLHIPGCFSQLLFSSCNSDPETAKEFILTKLLGRDPNECFFKIIIGPRSERDFVFPSDLLPYVQVMVESHESLKFLKDEPNFLEKFVDFIVTRCFYVLDPDLRGTASLRQFRRIDIAAKFLRSERMPDVNENHLFFNYQHFYVAFCKFWDLDVDNDGFITRDELLKHNDSSISHIVIDRFFNSSFYPRSSTKKSQIDFVAFVYFLISCEDKTSKTAINFWFKICDLDDDGILSVHEIEQLYELQYEQMKIQGHEIIPFDDIYRQLVDMINPENPSFFTIEDLEKSKLADVFFNTLFDLPKFLAREYQFPPPNQNMEDSSKGLSPWEIFVLMEYDALVNDSG